MKKEVKKVEKKAEKKITQPKTVRPMTMQTVFSKEKVEFSPFKRDDETLGKLEEGHVRVIVLIDYKGMNDELYAGDIIDVPERRYKSLSLRGLVKEYKGTNTPNRLR
jgi:hypothetical protein